MEQIVMGGMVAFATLAMVGLAASAFRLPHRKRRSRNDSMRC